MRIVFASDHTYLPHRVGGRESSIDEMASRYQSCGHEVTVLALKPFDQLPQIRKFISRVILGQRWNPSYRIVRTWNLAATMGSMLENRQADCYIINFEHVERYAQTPLARSIGNQVIYLRDLESIEQVTPHTFPRRALLVANSEYTAREFSVRTGSIPLVIRPLITPERYATRTSGEYVTFISPVQNKGVDIALSIAAALPDIPFLFVEGWPMSRSHKARMRQRIAPLGNVRLWGTVLDMRRVYSRTRLLIVPSVWREGFGRVVVEAQASGIASVASGQGGIPEAVAGAGILLKPNEPISSWADAVRRVWMDSSLRASLSRAARVMAHRHYHAALAGANRLLELLARGAGSTGTTTSDLQDGEHAAER
jgi:glycosyltransferase involved in cell wall biosynthesis